MSERGSCWVMFPATRAVSIERAKEVLVEKGLDVKAARGGLDVAWGDGPVLHVALATGPGVREESAEVAEEFVEPGPERDALAACDARFEVEFELEETLDEINTLIDVQLGLQEATGGYLFNLWNQELQPPESH